MGVVCQHQLGAQLRFIQFVALTEGEGVGGQKRRRRQTIQSRGDRYCQHIDLVHGQRMQGAQALGDQILVGREAVIGQRFPVRQLAHAQGGAKQQDFLGQPLGSQGIGAEHQNRRFMLEGQVGNQAGIARARGHGLRVALTGA